MLSSYATACLLIAGMCALYALIAAIIAAAGRFDNLATSARNAVVACAPLTAIAAAVLVDRLLAGDYGLQAVYETTSRTLPDWLRVGAIWASKPGALLGVTCLLSLSLGAALLIGGKDRRARVRWDVIAAALLMLFCLGWLIGWENPFARRWVMPGGEIAAALFTHHPALAAIDNLLMRLPGSPVAISAPAGATPAPAFDGLGLVPRLRHPALLIAPLAFAAGSGSLIATPILLRAGSTQARRWALIAPLLLGSSLLLADKWAWELPDWDWPGWTLPGNPALLLWLIGAAALHALWFSRRKGGAGVPLLIAALLLALPPVYTLARLIPPLSQSLPPLADRLPVLTVGLVLAGLSALAALVDLLVRARVIRQERGLTYLPTLLALLWHDRARSGGLLIHVGLAVTLIGLYASHTYPETAEVDLVPGSTVEAGGTTFTVEAIEQFAAADSRLVIRARVCTRRGDRDTGCAAPRIDRYADDESISVPGYVSRFSGDVTGAEIADLREDTGTLRAIHLPRANWPWAGLVMAACGAMIAATARE
ncbi:MAG: hypothetical protein JXJ17_00780 [Anaerolineae bacterium]|nr:hypothetical protein [Anaerolineae bacterium]